ncbi:FtsW/RodA/SpoVE family cell cycle protein [Bacteroidota bacterium]
MNLRRYIKGDRIIWAVILILFIVSLLSVYSSTGSLAYKYRSGDTLYYLFRQLRYVVLGLVVIFFFHLVPYKVFSRVSMTIIYIAAPLLLFTLFKGESRNEAARWLMIPGTGLTIQPSDFAKVALVMFVAKVLSVNQNNIKDFKGVFLKLAVAVSIICALILPANFSTAAIVFVTAFTLMFIGRVPFKHLFLFVAVGIAGLGLFLLLSSAMSKEGRISTWKNRIEAFIDGGGDNYQADQAKVAVVRGGLFPNGPGTSTQRNLLPHPYSDFIYAIIIEEYGSLIGGVLLLALYLWLLFRTGLIVRKSKSTYAAFLAFGLTLGLVLQAFVNMGVAVGLLPVTGQTLPLVSMGGSSILFNSMAMGMILSVSWGIKKELEEEAQAEEAVQAAEEPLQQDQTREMKQDQKKRMIKNLRDNRPEDIRRDEQGEEI